MWHWGIRKWSKVKCNNCFLILFYVERYETPKRVLKMDFLSSAFSSPNDPDGQNDIFWDQNSPMTKQLGNLLLIFLSG